MDKLEVIRKVNEYCNSLNLHLSNFVLSAGSALVILGIRENTDDLDVDIDKNTFLDLEKISNIEYFGESKILNLDSVLSLHILNDVEVMEVDGVYIYSISSLIKQKKGLINSPLRPVNKLAKDKEDLARLEEMLLTKK